MKEIWAEPGGQRLFREELEQGRLRYLVAAHEEHPDAAVRIDTASPEVVIFQDGVDVCIAVETHQITPFLITPLLAGYLVQRLGFAVRFSHPGFVVRTVADGITRVVKSEARPGRV